MPSFMEIIQAVISRARLNFGDGRFCVQGGGGGVGGPEWQNMDMELLRTTEHNSVRTKRGLKVT